MTEFIKLTFETEVSMLEVEQEEVSMIELPSSVGSSLFQAFSSFLSLDGGRPGDDFTHTEPLDGGGVQ